MSPDAGASAPRRKAALATVLPAPRPAARRPVARVPAPPAATTASRPRGPPVLLLRQATRRYGDVVALNRCDLEVGPGVTALVGPNGAGKSTLMKLATGHVRPTSGSVTAFGEPIADNPRVLARMGYVPEADAFYEAMPGAEFVSRLATIQGMGRAEARRAAEDELTALGLLEAWDQPLKTYSKGMRQRVKLAQALVHRPDLLFMDEPMLGCDPVARRRIHDRVLALEREGCTILVSSHILPEMERLTTDIAILKGGRLLARGRAAQVRDELAQIPSRVRLHTAKPRLVAAQVAGWEGVDGIRVGPGHVDIDTPRLRAFLGDLHERAPRTWALEGHETLDADLDSIFRYVSGGQA